MSTFNGRRAPNVSQYVANLNAIPSPHDVATQHQEPFNLEDDLAMFTNTEFFDFDLGDTSVPAPVDYEQLRNDGLKAQSSATRRKDVQGMDYMNGLSHLRSSHNAIDTDDVLSGNYPFPGYPAGGFAPPEAPSVASKPVHTPFPNQHLVSSRNGSPTSPMSGPSPGEKRPFDGAESNAIHSLEDASRLAAEEDKRRRNTAASARFRVKKKQREQNLERTAKEMTDKAAALEARIGQLEMENKWLKSLITEKNENKDDVADLRRKFVKQGTDARSTSERKDGVGTNNATEKS